MPRLQHGKLVTTEMLDQARRELADGGAAEAFAFAVAAPADPKNVDLLFPQLQDDPANLLPESSATVAALKRLAETMADFDDGPDAGADSPIPAAYTYPGQFIDHDITLEVASGSAAETLGGLLAPEMAPLPLEEVRHVLRNGRTATMDLDSLYGLPAPRDPANSAKMLVGSVSELGHEAPPLARPGGKGIETTSPRTAQHRSRPRPGGTDRRSAQ